MQLMNWQLKYLADAKTLGKLVGIITEADFVRLALNALEGEN